MSLKKDSLARDGVKTSYAATVNLFKSVNNRKLYRSHDSVNDDTIVAQEILLCNCDEFHSASEVLRALLKLFVTYNGLIKTLSFNCIENSLLIEFIYPIETTFSEMLNIIKYGYIGEVDNHHAVERLLFNSYIHIDLKVLAKLGFTSDIFKVDIYQHKTKLTKFVAAQLPDNRIIDFL